MPGFIIYSLCTAGKKVIQMNAIKSAVAHVDSTLDSFWIGSVLRCYHQVQASRYRRKATRLSRISTSQPAYAAVSQMAGRHKLEAELLLVSR